MLVDANVLLDVMTDDPVWGERSAQALEACADRHLLAINSVIYAEISVGFDRIEDLEAALEQFREIAGDLGVEENMT